MASEEKKNAYLNSKAPFSLPHRAWLALNKTPARYAIKASVSLLHWRQKQLRKQLATHFPYSAKLKEHADRLRNEGYTVLSNDIIDQNILEELSEFTTHRVEKSHNIRQIRKHKFIWVRLLDEDVLSGCFSTNKPYVLLALQQNIIHILSDYFGEIPFLNYVLLTLSQPTHGTPVQSQLWHRDFDDPVMCKFFVYLSDVVDDSDGPFTFFPAPISKNIKLGLIPRHLPDHRIFNQVDKKLAVKVLGKKLSCFLVDTSRCIHMGSRLHPEKSRLLYTATFQSIPYSYSYKKLDNGISIDTEVSEIEKLVLRY